MPARVQDPSLSDLPNGLAGSDALAGTAADASIGVHAPAHHQVKHLPSPAVCGCQTPKCGCAMSSLCCDCNAKPFSLFVASALPVMVTMSVDHLSSVGRAKCFCCVRACHRVAQAAQLNGPGPGSPPPCRGFKSMKMRWLRQYEDDQKRRSTDSDPPDRRLEDDAAADEDQQQTEARPGGAFAAARGAASSSQADGVAVASGAVTSAAAIETRSKSASGEEPDSSAAPGAVVPTPAAGSMLAAEQTGAVQHATLGHDGTVSSDRQPAQEVLADGTTEAAVVRMAASPPTSVAAECGSGAPPVAAMESQLAAPMLSASGPANAGADSPADRRLAATATQEVSASRGSSPRPEAPPRPSEGGSDSSAAHGMAEAATSAGAEAAAMTLLLPPPDAGYASASDTLDSPDLPPHLAKLGLRMDAPAEPPNRRQSFDAGAANGPVRANRLGSGAAPYSINCYAHLNNTDQVT